jgi:hypothetical protein
MKKERKLSVFSPAPYRKRDIFHRILWFFGSINCAWQRAIKGYCYRDLWSMDWFYTQLFINSIREFKKNLRGAPQEFFDNDAENQIERWENYLEEMAQHFYNSLEENEVQKNEYEEEFYRLNKWTIERDENGYIVHKQNTDPAAISARKKWLEREKELASWRREELNKGLDMLKKSFTELWD